MITDSKRASKPLLSRRIFALKHFKPGIAVKTGFEKMVGTPNVIQVLTNADDPIWKLEHSATY
jgi:hypothetical protein